MIASFLFAYGLVSKRLMATGISGPMLFMVFGLIIGSTSFLAHSVEIDQEVIRLLLEGTLVIVLFTDATLIDIGAVRKEFFLPGRLLGIGLPLTMVVGAFAAFVLFDGIGFWEATVIAVILAPTDAALGQAVHTDKSVPALIRQRLGVESSLNDGIAVPFLTIAVAGVARLRRNRCGGSEHASEVVHRGHRFHHGRFQHHLSWNVGSTVVEGVRIMVQPFGRS